MTEYIDNKKIKSTENDNFYNDTDYPHPDLTYLNALAEGDEAFIKEMLTLFLDSAPALTDSMRESARQGDFEKLHFSAHQLLPQLTFVGILAAIPDVSKIENEGKHMTDLSVYMERAIKIINYGMEDLKKLL